MLFKDLNLDIELQEALNEINYETLTPIQEKAIEKILEKRDILGIAQTGSGKTGAFSIPILQLLLDSSKKELITNFPKVIILAPTRELVIQITENIKSYSKYTKIKCASLYGSVEFDHKENYEIIITTPEKLDDLTNEKIIDLDSVRYFVLDEVDKMLEIGSSFYVKKVIKKLPKLRQSIFFSATVSPEIEKLIDEILVNPVKVNINEEKVNTDLIEQFVLFTKKEFKYKLLLEILNKKEVKSTIVFANSRKEVDNIVRFLSNNNIDSFSIHSKKSEPHRLKAIEDIKSKKTRHLIATDLASRGLDIPDITHVINFELPTLEEVYVHRIGRTARYNKKGVAYSFCSPEERNFLDRIEKLLKSKLKVYSHEFHSEFAKNATGKDAKPQFKRVKKFSKKNKKAKKTQFTLKK